MADDPGQGTGGLTIRISPRTILTFVALVALAWAVVVAGGTLLVIFVAVFLAFVLSPVVDAVSERLKMGRGAAASLVVLGAAALIGLLLLVVLAPIVSEVGDFAREAPRIVDEIENSAIGDQLSRGEAKDVLQRNTGAIVSGVGNAAGGLLGFAASAFGVFIMAFSLVFMTLFLVKDLPSYRRSILGLLGNASAERWGRISDEVITSTSRYMIGNLAISVVCALTYWATAAILGLPYALALGVIAGLLDLIPNIGATIAGVIIGIVALSVSTTALVVFVVVMIVYQQVENYILQPTIIGKAADLSGFLVIVSVLFWGALFGVVGAIIGVPITVAILIVVKELTSERRARLAEGRTSADTS